MDRDLRHRSRLRVVTLIDGILPAGGGERLAHEIIMRLDPDRFERTLCVSRWSPESIRRPDVQAVLRRLDDAGVRFLGLERRSARDLAAWRSLLSYLRRERIDVLHAHKFGSNAWAAILGTIARTPVVVAHEHTWSFVGQPMRRFLDRNLIARNVDAFLTVSREDRRRMIEIERIPAAKLMFVPNGIAPLASPSGGDVRRELGIGPDVAILGTVGSLRPQKAFDILIRAMAILVEREPEVRLLIVGEGDQRDVLERQIADLGLATTVTLLGYRPDVPDVLRALDIAVSSSDFEGTPLSILEYMDAGLPVVSTRVGGVPDLIEPGVHGLLVERGDHVALAEAIADLLADRARAAEMGRQARDRRRREFDIEGTAREVGRIYERLAAQVSS